jgi:gliding motility-associated-like protein
LVATGNFGPNANVTWDLGPTGAPPLLFGDSVWAALTVPGHVAVVLTVSEHGCTDSFTDSLHVYPDVLAGFTSDTAGCRPFPVSFVQQSSAGTPISFHWDLGDGTSSTDAQPVHVYPAPGQYDVSLTVMTSSGCVDTITLIRPDWITVYQPPVAGFLLPSPSVNVFDPVLHVLDASQDAVQWDYSIDGSTYDTPDVTHVFSDGGTFVITQVVYSGLSCSDTATAVVNVVGDLFYAPNAFTPDGDGVNDVFLPSVLGALTYELGIYDRWGRQLFVSDSVQQGWDGDGASQGVYVYKVRYSTLGAKVRERTGSVTLLR